MSGTTTQLPKEYCGAKKGVYKEGTPLPGYWVSKHNRDEHFIAEFIPGGHKRLWPYRGGDWTFFHASLYEPAVAGRFVSKFEFVPPAHDRAEQIDAVYEAVKNKAPVLEFVEKDLAHLGKSFSGATDILPSHVYRSFGNEGWAADQYRLNTDWQKVWEPAVNYLRLLSALPWTAENEKIAAAALSVALAIDAYSQRYSQIPSLRELRRIKLVQAGLANEAKAIGSAFAEIGEETPADGILALVRRAGTALRGLEKISPDRAVEFRKAAVKHVAGMAAFLAERGKFDVVARLGRAAAEARLALA